MPFRFIHTADWHLGRVFHQISLLDDQRVLLDNIYQQVIAAKADAVIIAGDIFDRANPRREAIDLFSAFLSKLYKNTDMAIILIAGNHDAPELIGYGGILQDRARVVIAGPLKDGAFPLLVEPDSGPPVAISALPFADIYAAREYFSDSKISSIEDILKCQLQEAHKNVPDGARWIVVAHSFLQSGRDSQSERPLDYVGGIETVAASAFRKADYVALGHLHRAQRIKSKSAHIRYSGSIMAFGFDEVDTEKSMLCVDMDDEGNISVDKIMLVAPRALRIVTGLFADILEQEANENSDDFIKFELADELPAHDAMNRLRSLYPNAVQLEWINLQRDGKTGASIDRIQRNRSTPPGELFSRFFEEVSGRDLNPAMQRALHKTIAGLEKQERQE